MPQIWAFREINPTENWRHNKPDREPKRFHWLLVYRETASGQKPKSSQGEKSALSHEPTFDTYDGSLRDRSGLQHRDSADRASGPPTDT